MLWSSPGKNIGLQATVMIIYGFQDTCVSARRQEICCSFPFSVTHPDLQVIEDTNKTVATQVRIKAAPRYQE